MSVRILVPLDAVSKAADSIFMLDHPLRCSRCNQEPANFFETHRLKILAGPKRSGLTRAKFEFSRDCTLKIRVCETCYQSDFLTNPEVFDRDRTPLGRRARLITAGYTAGAIVAAAGILMLTNILSALGFPASINNYWRIPAVSGLVVIAIVWLLQKQQQSKVQRWLTANGFNSERSKRAKILHHIIDNMDDPAAVPLEIEMGNEPWTMECANHLHWSSQTYPAGKLIGEESTK